MKVAIEIFVSLFILVLTISLCIGLISSNLEVLDARDCYYSCINELQESNFSDSVALACISNANQEGYSLFIDIFESADGSRSATVKLGYKYKMPPFGISQDKVIEGFVN